MEFAFDKSTGLHVSGMPETIARVIQNVLKWQDENFLDDHSGDVEARLLPSPSLDPEEEALRRDWKSCIEPDLLEFFRSARDIVAADLRTMSEGPCGHEMCIPTRHLESWLHALGQSRLALAEKYGFVESELSRPVGTESFSPRDEAHFQIEIYGELQELLVQLIMAE